MIIHPWASVGQPGLASHAVAGTIGVFDGVHRGHQFLLEELLRPGSGVGEPLVVTFRENPKRFLNPSYPGDLMTWQEKRDALASAGVEHIVVIDFSLDFSKIPGRDFFLTLKKSFRFSKLVLGWDFSFGKGSSTTAADIGWLADAETHLTILPPLRVGGTIVSSSAIRTAITDGDLHGARSLLGRSYEIPLEPPFYHVDGMTSVERSSVRKLLPPPGTYQVRIDGERAELRVETDRLTWESPPGTSFHQIVFV